MRRGCYSFLSGVTVRPVYCDSCKQTIIAVEFEENRDGQVHVQTINGPVAQELWDAIARSSR